MVNRVEHWEPCNYRDLESNNSVNVMELGEHFQFENISTIGQTTTAISAEGEGRRCKMIDWECEA